MSGAAMPSGSRVLRTHWPSLLALVLGMALLLVPFVLQREIREDEFTLLSDALRQARGAVIYRDFFEFITPLSEWPAAIAFRWVGPSLLVARVLQGLALIGAGLQMCWLARRLGCGPWAATLPAWLLLLALFRNWPVYSHHWWALPFLLGAVQAAFRAAAGAGARWWAIAGACAAGLYLTIQLDGLAVFAALAISIPALALLMRRSWRAAGREWLALAFGAAVPIGLMAANLALHHALFAAWRDTWNWPLHHYKAPGNENDVAWGSDWRATLLPVSRMPGWLGRAYYLLALYMLAPTSVLAGATWVLARLWRRMTWTDAHRQMSLTILITMVLLAAATRGKCDLVHIAMYSVLPALLSAAFVERLGGWGRLLGRVALLLVVVTGALFQWRMIEAHRGDWLQASSPDAYFEANPVVRYIRAHTRPADRILVLPIGGLYYFYAAPPESPYTEIEPPWAHYMTQSQYTEIWRRIGERDPKFVIFATLGGERALPGMMARPLAGYRRVRSLRPEYGPDFPAYVFVREGVGRH